MSKQNQPIGVFDSGVGGLTVLKALIEHLPQESFLYLGDTAHLPYGTKSEYTIRRYAKQMAAILKERDIKMLVIACNTSTAVALDTWREALPGIPVIGVIEPGALAACQATRNDHIAVIATEGTIRHGAYNRAIQQVKPLAVIRSAPCP
jgi:glutamate racemase